MGWVTMNDQAAFRTRGAISGEREAAQPANRPKLVLVVDDDPIVLEVARERLERFGMTVATRNESLGTSRWILENDPDFVLLDLMMPALTGSELARVLKRRQVKAAIIVHSSLPQAHLDKIAREVGAIGALSKALDDAEFERHLKRLVSRHGDSSRSP